MKNKKLISCILVTFFAFMLYSANLRHIENAKIKIVEPKTTKTAKKQEKEPEITASKAPSYTDKKKTKTADSNADKGSNKSLVAAIEKAMGNQGNYQVAVQDLNNSSRYARVATSKKSHNVSTAMELFLLTALYKQRQSGKIKTGTSIKIKKSDRAKGEKYLTTNMLYGIAYLRQAMMTGNKTAANALLRKVGKANVNKVAAQFGATDTAMVGTFTKKPVGHTTANDLDSVLKGLYQGKVLNRQNAQNVLMAMRGHNNPLINGLNGTIYSVGDKYCATALVQNTGHSYAVSVWSESGQNLNKLGKAVEKWFNKAR